MGMKIKPQDNHFVVTTYSMCKKGVTREWSPLLPPMLCCPLATGEGLVLGNAMLPYFWTGQEGHYSKSFVDLGSVSSMCILLEGMLTLARWHRGSAMECRGARKASNWAQAEGSDLAEQLERELSWEITSAFKVKSKSQTSPHEEPQALVHQPTLDSSATGQPLFWGALKCSCSVYFSSLSCKHTKHCKPALYTRQYFSANSLCPSSKGTFKKTSWKYRVKITTVQSSRIMSKDRYTALKDTAQDYK